MNQWQQGFGLANSYFCKKRKDRSWKNLLKDILTLLPTTDGSPLRFKKLFGEEPNKDLLLDFLKELLREEQGEILNLTYFKNEHLGSLEGGGHTTYAGGFVDTKKELHGVFSTE